MSRGIVSRFAAFGLAVAWASLSVPGCTIRFVPGTGEDAEEGTVGGEDGDPAGGDATFGEPEKPMTEEELADEPFEGTDPQELALASAKAEVTTAFLAVMIESLGLDPATVDEAALAELMQQYMPTAAEEAEKWIATIDPSTLALVPPSPQECDRNFGCLTPILCAYGFAPGNHRCDVTECGVARCSLCPPWIAEQLQNIVIKSWCGYVCTQVRPTPGKIVAYAAAGISRFRNYYLGPICVAPW
ncbi:uncharacterized protein SOCE26_057030 [Sorangium cellulosum]|uniref:Secreted protein n=2 Tax=Sorangium cellulosum TaxID=56 RepID=A0A2L0EYC3_SORCE|nr:uncharacterized protein SOCE26_057030 [Sorangium cellulosum]